MRPRLMAIDSVGVEGRTLEFVLDPGEVAAELAERGCADVKPGEPVRASLELVRDAALVRIRGRVTGLLEQTCVRCLEPAVQKIDREFTVVVKKASTRDEDVFKGEVELNASDLEIELLEGENLDLNEVALDELVCQLPEYPLCRKECRGLCPTCGDKLGKGECECGREKPVDPRLAALLKLKEPKR